MSGGILIINTFIFKSIVVKAAKNCLICIEDRGNGIVKGLEIYNIDSNITNIGGGGWIREMNGVGINVIIIYNNESSIEWGIFSGC